MDQVEDGPIDGTNVTGIAIQRATNAAFTTGVNTTNVTPATLATRTMTGLTANTTYFYRVATRTAVGNSARSNVVTFTTLP